MRFFELCPSSLYTPRDMQRLQRFYLWFFGAMVSFAAATVLMSRAHLRGAPAWALAAATVALLIAAVRSYLTFLRSADELLRKVHVEAAALAAGATMVFVMGYRLCERLGAWKADVNDSVIVMFAAFAIGQWLGARRYAGGEP